MKNYDLIALYTKIEYKGCIKRVLEEIEKFKKMENYLIPKEFNYDKVEGLSLESKQRLKEIRPISLGQASRIRGIRPSDLTLIMVYLKKLKNK